jgi:hypothetical protein
LEMANLTGLKVCFCNAYTCKHIMSLHWNSILIDSRIIAVCAWYYPATGDDASKCNQNS